MTFRRQRRRFNIFKLLIEVVKKEEGIVSTRQICVMETKNLAAEPQKIEVLRETTIEDIKETGAVRLENAKRRLWQRNDSR
jgi:hypothetical protein